MNPTKQSVYMVSERPRQWLQNNNDSPYTMSLSLSLSRSAKMSYSIIEYSVEWTWCLNFVNMRRIFVRIPCRLLKQFEFELAVWNWFLFTLRTGWIRKLCPQNSHSYFCLHLCVCVSLFKNQTNKSMTKMHKEILILSMEYFWNGTIRWKRPYCLLNMRKDWKLIIVLYIHHLFSSFVC